MARQPLSGIHMIFFKKICKFDHYKKIGFSVSHYKPQIEYFSYHHILFWISTHVWISLPAFLITNQIFTEYQYMQ